MKPAIGTVTIGFLFVLISSLGGQTVETRRVMRDKLGHGQRMLEALTTSDFALLERESAALVRVTESPQWQLLRTPEFRTYSGDFQKAAKEVADAARQHDLDAAAERYQSLVGSCYSCHKYLKGRRLAQ
jgi:hypothetical protein